MKNDAKTILKSASFFSEVDQKSLSLLSRMAEARAFEKGEMVFHQGHPPPGVFVVRQGLVRLFLVAPNGKEHILHLAGEGTTFGEVAAMGRFPLPANAEAVEPTTCLLLPTAPFNSALKQNHRLSLQIVASLTGWVRRFVGSLEGIVLRDAAGRLADFFLKAKAEPSGHIVLPSQKKFIASHLNLTSETLSRSLRQLKQAGLLQEIQPHRFHIPDRKKLEQAAEGLFPEL